jgi:hypothetical protein
VKGKFPSISTITWSILKLKGGIKKKMETTKKADFQSAGMSCPFLQPFVWHGFQGCVLSGRGGAVSSSIAWRL